MSEAAEAAPAVAEEYASVTISIDHLLLTANTGGHTVVKNVWSTESAVEALLAQLDYFGLNGLLRDPGVISMIDRGNEKASVFILEGRDGLTNVIVDAQIWTDVLGNDEMSQGTVLGAHAALIALATDLKRAAAAEGKSSPLLAWVSND